MNEDNYRILGRTGLKVGRLGVACSHGAPTRAFEEAFDHGVNYFYWGSTRKPAMALAIRNVIAKGQRGRLVIVIQSYSRSALLMERFYLRALKTLKIDTADILLLGWHNRPPSPRILERALEMKEQGLFRFLALSGHNRPLFDDLSSDQRFDLFHVRYNAVHRGAETYVFRHLPETNRPGIVTYTATRWGGPAQIEPDAASRSPNERHGLLPLRAFQSKCGCLHVRPQRFGSNAASVEGS
jgi:aryl-alcohol dehydrogenase-like predicted oxidoreductase